MVVLVVVVVNHPVRKITVVVVVVLVVNHLVREITVVVDHPQSSAWVNTKHFYSLSLDSPLQHCQNRCGILLILPDAPALCHTNATTHNNASGTATTMRATSLVRTTRGQEVRQKGVWNKAE